MKVLAKGAEANKSTTVKGNVVTCVHSTLHKPSDTNYQLTTTFDFSDVGPDDILRLATETVLIRWRVAFKNADSVDDTSDNQVVKVKDMLKGAKPRMSKAARALKTLSEMSDEEKAAFIKEHAEALGIKVSLSE
jgi:hypothetical protein